MPREQKFLAKITPVLVYSRPLLVFAGMLCAIAVMLTQNPAVYLAGTLLFFASMVFDLVDGWFAARFGKESPIVELAERIMNRVVYSIIFPLVAVGMMWRLAYVFPEHSRPEMLHALFVLLLCVVVLIRDNLAHFMRGIAVRYAQEPELRELTFLRTIVAAPLGFLLYVYAFFIPVEGETSWVYASVSGLGNLPLRNLFIIEIIFLVINFGSMAGYMRKYGTYCLDDLCLGDALMRRRILSVFPNALTVMNAMMGLLAVFFAYQGKMRESYLLLIGAAVFDKLDGAIARRLGLTEPLVDTKDERRITLGAVLDDVADGVSFCIVPAWIFFICLSQLPFPDVHALPIGSVALIYALAGFARLAYFTLDKNPIPGIFKGLPVPAAALFVVAALVILCQNEFLETRWAEVFALFCFGLMIFTAVLMNLYPVRYIHMGRFMDRNPWFTRITLVGMLIFVFTPWFGHLSFLLMSIYLLSPIATRGIDPETAARETPQK